MKRSARGQNDEIASRADIAPRAEGIESQFGMPASRLAELNF
jgi:hypothetical protein